MAGQWARARATIERANGRNLRRAYVYLLVLLAAAIWVLAFIGVVLWTRRLSRPIRQLTQGLSEVAAGRLEQRVEVSRYDEIGTAIETFNRMTAASPLSRAPGLRDAARKLAGSRAQDRARSEEFSDPHPPHHGGGRRAGFRKR